MADRLPRRYRTAGDEPFHADAHLKLMTFMSPAFPVGGFAYSHGLETLIVQRRIRHAATLADWLVDLLRLGNLRNDAVLFVEAFNAAATRDRTRLAAAAELSAALPAARERHMETTAQGSAFLAAASASWGCDLTDGLSVGEVGYPVAVGATCAVHAIPIEASLASFLNATCSTLVSVAVRLVPLGQTAGLAVLSKLHVVIADILPMALSSSLDDLGSAAILSDIAAMQHETLYSRVFRT